MILDPHPLSYCKQLLKRIYSSYSIQAYPSFCANLHQSENLKQFENELGDRTVEQLFLSKKFCCYKSGHGLVP